jgi:hypothetical protein
MKKLIALMLVVSIGLSAWSQSTVTNIRFNKADRPALMLELPYEPAIAEEFILDTLKKSGYEPQTSGIFKSKKVDGFYHFKGVKLQGSDRAADLYFKVEEKSKREKGVSIVYLLMDKGTEDFVNSGDGAIHVAGKGFMNSMTSQSAQFKLKLDIEAQEYALKDAEKKMEKLLEEEKRLAKRLEELQNDLKLNKQDQESQKKAVENEKTKLAGLKGKG